MRKMSGIKPGGWLKTQMQLDLREGIIGNYDRISDNVNGHLFAKRDRRAGNMVVGNRGLQEKAWWAGEPEGYWKNSVVRMAFLADDESFKAKARVDGRNPGRAKGKRLHRDLHAGDAVSRKRVRWRVVDAKPHLPSDA